MFGSSIERVRLQGAIHLPTFEDVQNVRRQLLEVSRQYWTSHTVFTWQWWLLIALSLLPWFIWWKFVDKKRVIELSLYGAMIAMISVLLDTIGTNAMFWGYPRQPLWFIYFLWPADFSILPVGHMLVYQYFSKWKTFILAEIAFAVVASFLIEPLFSWSGMYILYSWKYIYSTPLYVLKAIIARLVVQRLLQVQRDLGRKGA